MTPTPNAAPSRNDATPDPSDAQATASATPTTHGATTNDGSTSSPGQGPESQVPREISYSTQEQMMMMMIQQLQQQSKQLQEQSKSNSDENKALLATLTTHQTTGNKSAEQVAKTANNKKQIENRRPKNQTFMSILVWLATADAADTLWASLSDCAMVGTGLGPHLARNLNDECFANDDTLIKMLFHALVSFAARLDSKLSTNKNVQLSNYVNKLMEEFHDDSAYFKNATQLNQIEDLVTKAQEGVQWLYRRVLTEEMYDLKPDITNYNRALLSVCLSNNHISASFHDNISVTLQNKPLEKNIQMVRDFKKKEREKRTQTRTIKTIPGNAFGQAEHENGDANPCWAYKEGSCWRGDSCRFTHDNTDTPKGNNGSAKRGREDGGKGDGKGNGSAKRGREHGGKGSGKGNGAKHDGKGGKGRGGKGGSDNKGDKPNTTTEEEKDPYSKDLPCHAYKKYGQCYRIHCDFGHWASADSTERLGNGL
jgi:hypothetical protein